MLLNKKIPIRYFFDLIKYQILLISLFSLVIGLLDLLPFFQRISLPLTVPVIIGTAVSLLLAFRISQSYERWWEARIVWGQIVNDSRTLVRLIVQALSDHNEIAIKKLVSRQIIWCYALGESLRKLDFSEKVLNYLNENRLQASNIPSLLLDMHSLDIKQIAYNGQISEFRVIQINDTIARLCDSMGKCERIKNTVFPRLYSNLIHSLIYVFTIVLPFGLEDSEIWEIIIEVLITILLSTLFFAIEKTAIVIQDPFENTPVDTPMTSLAQTIEINLLEMSGERDIPRKNSSLLYYEM